MHTHKRDRRGAHNPGHPASPLLTAWGEWVSRWSLLGPETGQRPGIYVMLHWQSLETAPQAPVASDNAYDSRLLLTLDLPAGILSPRLDVQHVIPVAWYSCCVRLVRARPNSVCHQIDSLAVRSDQFNAEVSIASERITEDGRSGAQSIGLTGLRAVALYLEYCLANWTAWRLRRRRRAGRGRRVGAVRTLSLWFSPVRVGDERKATDPGQPDHNDDCHDHAASSFEAGTECVVFPGRTPGRVINDNDLFFNDPGRKNPGLRRCLSLTLGLAGSLTLKSRFPGSFFLRLLLRGRAVLRQPLRFGETHRAVDFSLELAGRFLHYSSGTSGTLNQSGHCYIPPPISDVRRDATSNSRGNSPKLQPRTGVRVFPVDVALASSYNFARIICYVAEAKPRREARRGSQRPITRNPRFRSAA